MADILQVLKFWELEFWTKNWCIWKIAIVASVGALILILLLWIILDCCCLKCCCGKMCSKGGGCCSCCSAKRGAKPSVFSLSSHGLAPHFAGHEGRFSFHFILSLQSPRSTGWRTTTTGSRKTLSRMASGTVRWSCRRMPACSAPCTKLMATQMTRTGTSSWATPGVLCSPALLCL